MTTPEVVHGIARSKLQLDERQYDAQRHFAQQLSCASHRPHTGAWTSGDMRGTARRSAGSARALAAGAGGAHGAESGRSC
jgi:hypothetical protein